MASPLQATFIGILHLVVKMDSSPRDAFRDEPLLITVFKVHIRCLIPLKGTGVRLIKGDIFTKGASSYIRCIAFLGCSGEMFSALPLWTEILPPRVSFRDSLLYNESAPASVILQR